MDTYELADLMALSSAERATLNCVQVRGQTRATLVGLTTQLGARLCTKSCCSTETTSFDDAKWPHSCCSSCHHTQLGAARRGLRCRVNERFGQDHHYCSTRWARQTVRGHQLRIFQTVHHTSATLAHAMHGTSVRSWSILWDRVLLQLCLCL